MNKIEKIKIVYTPEQKAKAHERYLANKEEIFKRSKEWKKNNREKVLEGAAKYREKNSDKRAAYSLANREHELEVKRKYYAENKEKMQADMKQRYENDKERINARNNEYRKKNKEQIAAANREYRVNRMKTDIVFRIKQNCRTRVRDAMKGIGSKSAKTFELIGCTGEFLRGYLEAKFTNGMTWDNYGEWHIDHIIPLSKFDLIDPIEQRKAFHYTNTQPLWALENRMKADKLDWGILQ